MCLLAKLELISEMFARLFLVQVELGFDILL